MPPPRFNIGKKFRRDRATENGHKKGRGKKYPDGRTDVKDTQAQSYTGMEFFLPGRLIVHFCPLCATEVAMRPPLQYSVRDETQLLCQGAEKYYSRKDGRKAGWVMILTAQQLG